MDTPSIAFFDAKNYDKESFNEINKQFGFNIKYFKYHLTEDNAILAKGFDVVVVFVNDIITSNTINKLFDFGIRLIALRCSGFNNVDLEAAKNKIDIVRVPAYSPHAIAEHTVALMLTLNRKIHRAYFRTRDANFALHGLLGFACIKKTAGIIGTGRIGKALASILLGFKMRVLAYDPFPDREFEKLTGICYTAADEIFEQSDVISLNCPLTPETEYIVNKANIAKMKAGVMIINTGRGKLINTRDLIWGLKSARIGSAGLDVYEEESNYFFEDMSDQVLNDDVLARLLTFNNVIITSHQGFFTKEALSNIAETTLENIKDFFGDRSMPNRVGN
ncbi:MAG: 2-hydroxyacid dehydrogenase [Bacteroidales bacterium]|nr:2-hydroxyacid dehydrogenase [Bacteroidales bacterium]